MMTPAASGANFGRSALLIHGLMMLSAGVFAALSVQTTAITVNALGIPFAATFVLFGWSTLLAVRALRSAENSGWAAWVIAACSLEIGICFALAATQRDSVYAPLRWAYCFGLPIFVPALVVAILISALIARWRTSRAARTRTSEAWDRRRRWKYGLCWFVPMTFFLFSLLVPAPLFIYALSNYTENNYDSRGPFDAWVVRYTPVIVAEHTAAFFAGSTRPSWALIYTLAISSGRVSRERLMAEVNSSDSWLQKDALDGLEKADVAAALAQSEKIARSPTLGWVSEFSASRILGRHGSAEQVRPLLKSAEKASAATEFMDSLLLELAKNKRVEFVPDFARLAESNSPYREVALEILARIGPEMDMESSWLRWMNDPDETRALLVVESISYLSDLDQKRRLFKAASENPRANVRAAARTWQEAMH